MVNSKVEPLLSAELRQRVRAQLTKMKIDLDRSLPFDTRPVETIREAEPVRSPPCSRVPLVLVEKNEPLTARMDVKAPLNTDMLVTLYELVQDIRNDVKNLCLSMSKEKMRTSSPVVIPMWDLHPSEPAFPPETDFLCKKAPTTNGIEPWMETPSSEELLARRAHDILRLSEALLQKKIKIRHLKSTLKSMEKEMTELKAVEHSRDVVETSLPPSQPIIGTQTRVGHRSAHTQSTVKSTNPFLSERSPRSPPDTAGTTELPSTEKNLMSILDQEETPNFPADDLHQYPKNKQEKVTDELFTDQYLKPATFRSWSLSPDVPPILADVTPGRDFFDDVRTYRNSSTDVTAERNLLVDVVLDNGVETDLKPIENETFGRSIPPDVSANRESLKDSERSSNRRTQAGLPATAAVTTQNVTDTDVTSLKLRSSSPQQRSLEEDRINRLSNSMTRLGQCSSSMPTEPPTSAPANLQADPTGMTRMLALYSYDPTLESPNDDPEVELAFTAGDVITVFGPADPDGFYKGELNGRMGLVPSNFVRAVAPGGSITDVANTTKNAFISLRKASSIIAINKVSPKTTCGDRGPSVSSSTPRRSVTRHAQSTEDVHSQRKRNLRSRFDGFFKKLKMPA